jgi:mono/diheme cytochrome c family protein
MFDVLGVAALLAVAALGVWLVLRARRARNGAVKWIGGLLAGVVTLASVLAFALVLVGFYKVNFPAVRGTPSDIKVAATPEQLARGSKIAKICAGCHSPTEEPPLTGQNMFANGGPPVGTMYAANLTPAGEIKDWTDGEVIRAIREGIHKNGRSLIVMPAEVFRNLSDADVQSVVAFLRSQPATGAPTPPTKLNIVGALLIALVFPTAAQTPITQPVVAPVEGTSADYGKYLVSIADCRSCHGEHLAGRVLKGPGPPAGPNLTMIVPNWTAEQFAQTIRTGIDPNKRVLTAEMPWRNISGFATDDDLAAIYAYLHGLAPLPGPDK